MANRADGYGLRADWNVQLLQKKGTVLLSTSLAWPAVAGCSRAETFLQLSSSSFAQPCTCYWATRPEFTTKQQRRLVRNSKSFPASPRSLVRPSPSVQHANMYLKHSELNGKMCSWCTLTSASRLRAFPSIVHCSRVLF